MHEAAHTSTRVIGAPWTIQMINDGTQFPAITPLWTWGTLSFRSCRLTREQGRLFAAFHEAGHVALFRAAGFQVAVCEIYPDDPHAPDAALSPGIGHTELADPPKYYDPLDVFPAILAGQVAAEMWLERSGLLNVRSSLLAYCSARGDHDRLLLAESAVFLYGDAKPPEDWRGLVFRIDEFIDTARSRLEKSWPAVTAIAQHLDRYGSIGTDDLASIAELGKVS